MSLTHDERTKLTAADLITAAASLLTAGAVAPIAAAVFGVTGLNGGVATLTPGLGVAASRSTRVPASGWTAPPAPS